ncbi:MAG: phage holin family protein [Firmicutes bacterium]|nr:phage holin family protein [Bacillota bacterium]
MENRTKETRVNILSIITRVVLTALVVAVAAFLTPGFSISSLGTLLLAAIVIAVLDYLVERFTGIDATPFGRGIVGFIVAAGILYLTSYTIQGFNISILSAIIGALAIGIIDAILPGRVF